MNNVEEALNQLSNELNKCPEIVEFLRLKECFEKDEDLKIMRQEIARLTNEGKIKERDNLIEIYNSHPLVSNYQLAREEVISLLTQIKNILSD